MYTCIFHFWYIFIHMHTNLTYHKSWGGPPAPAGWVGWGRSPWTSGTIHGSHSPAAAHSCQALPLWLQRENTNSISDNNGSTLFSLMLAGALFNYMLCVCVCVCVVRMVNMYTAPQCYSVMNTVCVGSSSCYIPFCALRLHLLTLSTGRQIKINLTTNSKDITTNKNNYWRRCWQTYGTVNVSRLCPARICHINIKANKRCFIRSILTFAYLLKDVGWYCLCWACQHQPLQR